MKRIHPITGELFVPHLYRDGMYRVGNPAFGSDMKKRRYQIPVATVEELRAAVLKGFYVRMKGNKTRTVNLISPGKISLSAI